MVMDRNITSQKIEWITSIKQIESANDISLRRSLVTCDGSGYKVKQAALDELLRRSALNK